MSIACPPLAGEEGVPGIHRKAVIKKKGRNKMRKWKMWEIMVGGLSLIALAYFITTPLRNRHSPLIDNNENAVVSELRSLIICEATWLQQDMDGNKKKDYWTYDISCFYRMIMPRNPLTESLGDWGSPSIRLDLARADAAAAADDVFGKGIIENWAGITQTAVPKRGYLFRAMERDENGNLYNQNEFKGVKALNEHKFAFVAYPFKYNKTGNLTFIFNEEGTIYGIDTGSDAQKIILQWPGVNPETVDGPVVGRKWRRAD